MIDDAFREFTDEAGRAVALLLHEIGAPDLPIVIDRAPEGMGDLAFPCFPLAKVLKKAPAAIATELASKVQPGEFVERAEANGGYVNFHVRFERLAQQALEAALEQKASFGSGEHRKERVLLEHTSVNPTGPIHVGRARNPVIGDTLARIMRLAGYDVETEYYVNDVGRQVATMTWGVQNLRVEPSPERTRDDHVLVHYYQEANRRVEAEPKVLEEVDSLLYKLEHGDEAAIALNRETCQRVLAGIMDSLGRLNVSIDRFTWESAFVADGSVDGIIERLKRSEYCHERDGAFYLELESFGITGRDTSWVFTRADGTSLYTTRDLAYHSDKFGRTDTAINVLGEDQKLGMQQLAAALSILGTGRKPETVFYAFVSLPEGKMSTRSGKVVYIDDLIDEAVGRAYEEVKKRRTDLPEERMRVIARTVGVGALRYNIIRIQAEKQIVFKWEDALNFEGSSAPFIQYAHARACSILDKAEPAERGRPQAGRLVNEHERALAKLVASFPSVVRDCADNRRAHPIATYAQDLAAQFNQFYRFVPVLRAEGDTREARLALVEAAMWTLRNALTSLGLEAPEEM
jgi:arginyl-tRNA synthetase